MVYNIVVASLNQSCYSIYCKKILKNIARNFRNEEFLNNYDNNNYKDYLF